MKVNKSKFDALLGRLIKAEPGAGPRASFFHYSPVTAPAGNLDAFAPQS